MIKFLLKLEKKNSEIIENLQCVFGEVFLCKSSIYEWIKNFQGGLTSVKDVVRSGRPATSGNEENVVLIYGNKRLTCRELSDDSGLSIRSVHNILSNDLGMRRVSAKFVPRLLSDDQKAGRVTVCRELQEMQGLVIFTRFGTELLLFISKDQVYTERRAFHGHCRHSSQHY